MVKVLQENAGLLEKEKKLYMLMETTSSTCVKSSLPLWRPFKGAICKVLSKFTYTSRNTGGSITPEGLLAAVWVIILGCSCSSVTVRQALDTTLAWISHNAVVMKAT